MSDPLASFDLQGHRGARGLRPENTLPSFEAAFDAGASSVETDLHLTRDGIVVLCHDPILDARLFSPSLPPGTAVAGVTLTELRAWRADRNPDPARFPEQSNAVTPLAEWFAGRHGFDPYAVPTLADLFAFAAAYAGEAGAAAGKTPAQRERARRLRFDLELKRVPFHPEFIGDAGTGCDPGSLEQQLVEVVRAAGTAERTTVRCFDHRCVRWLRQLEPRLTGAVLVAHTAPVSPADLAREADAGSYCPSYEFLDEDQVRLAHAEGVRVRPWTVNEAEDWERLLTWGVDGLTTDRPDRLADWLRRRGVPF